MKSVLVLLVALFSSSVFAQSFTVYSCAVPGRPAVRARLVFDHNLGYSHAALKEVYIFDNYADGRNVSCRPTPSYTVGWDCRGTWNGLSESLFAEIHRDAGVIVLFELKRPAANGGNLVNLRCSIDW